MSVLRDDAVGDATVDREQRRFAMLIHLSLLAGYLVPLAGFVLPIVLWQIKKDEMPWIDRHGRNAVNWMITVLIAWAAFGVMLLTIVLIPVAIVLAFVISLASIALPVIAAIKAESGETWRYPVSFRFL